MAFAAGTEEVYPQDDNNQLYTWKPQKGARVHVTIGEAVDGSTLLAEVSQSVVRAPGDVTLWSHGMKHPKRHKLTNSNRFSLVTPSVQVALA
jgi:hypothetical protein